MRPTYRSKTLLLGLVLGLGSAACTTYPIAHDVKYLSFEDEDGAKGKPVGPVRGEDCVWNVAGIPLGGHPTLDRALASARTQTSSTIADSFGGQKETLKKDSTLRYVTNVSTDQDGFNFILVGKHCFVVKGTGYR